MVSRTTISKKSKIVFDFSPISISITTLTSKAKATKANVIASVSDDQSIAVLFNLLQTTNMNAIQLNAAKI